jgi:hypothetical protein
LCGIARSVANHASRDAPYTPTDHPLPDPSWSWAHSQWLVDMRGDVDEQASHFLWLSERCLYWNEGRIRGGNTPLSSAARSGGATRASGGLSSAGGVGSEVVTVVSF